MVHPLNAIACMLTSGDVALGRMPEWLVSGAGVGRGFGRCAVASLKMLELNVLHALQPSGC
jgi:hypothetical protein